MAESGEPGARSGWFVALSGKSALSRGSLGTLGINMHFVFVELCAGVNVCVYDLDLEICT